MGYTSNKYTRDAVFYADPSKATGANNLVLPGTAMPHVLARFPTARVLYMGQYQNVMGEEEYARKLAPMIEALGEHWTFLGNVSDPELVAFFRTCELTVLPSLNSTESFGMVTV